MFIKHCVAAQPGPKGEDLDRNVMMRHLHCIAEIRAYWIETKPSEIDNPRHHYQIA